MPVSIINHPLAKDCLTKLRDKNTGHNAYHTLSYSLATLVALSATTDLSTTSMSISTPMCDTSGEILDAPMVVVPILRAGLSMLPPVQALFPEARVGFIGLQRREHELEPEKYYLNVPQVNNAVVLLLDPMLATGGSILCAIKLLQQLSYSNIKVLSFLAAPEGIKLLNHEYPDINIYTASIDEKLDDHNYIIPGLGDFGDRLFGTSVLKSI